jgi:hypothetical protein
MNQTPDTTTTMPGDDLARQITTLTTRFAGHQARLGLKDGPFARRYSEFLGSEKTWTKLKDGTWAGHVNPERMLDRLKALDARLDGAAGFDEEAFLELPFVRRANYEFDRLLGSARDRRCLIILAPEGIGKSWWASRRLQDPKAAQPRFYLRVNHTWREKSFHLLRAMADKVGAPLAKNPAQQMAHLIDTLKSLGEVVFFIDEGHNGGVVLFKLLKDLIDETPARFVYMAFPTEFDAVRCSSGGGMAEARQLFRRSVKPIFDDWRSGVRPEDVAALMAGSGVPRGRELTDVAARLAPLLARNQNISTLADAIVDARDADEPLTADLVAAAVAGLCTTATERRAAEEAAEKQRREK